MEPIINPHDQRPSNIHDVTIQKDRNVKLVYTLWHTLNEISNFSTPFVFKLRLGSDARTHAFYTT